MTSAKTQMLLLLKLRWQIFRNALRKPNRQQEVAVQIVSYVMGALFVLGTSAGLLAGTAAMLNFGHPEFLGLMLWGVLLIWQLAPILFSGYSPGLNFSEVARYPVSFRLFFWLNTAYGLFDPAALTGIMWLLSIWLGIVIGRPRWALPAALAFLLFAAFNVFTNRIVIGLLERFQSTRKGRERMVIVLMVLMLAPQLLQFLPQAHNSVRVPGRLVGILTPLHAVSPPGLASGFVTHSGSVALFALALLALYCAIVVLLLLRHLRVLYEGEIYAESFSIHRRIKVEPGISFPGLDNATSSIIQKELLYVRQNSRMLVQLVYPVLVFFLLFFGNARQVFAKLGGSSSAVMLGGFAALVLLGMGNMGFNIFGMDRQGFSRWMLAPIPLQKIIFAKNLALALLILTVYLLAAFGIAVLTGMRLLPFVTVTVIFTAVLMVQMMVGNWVSVYWPKRVELSQMNSRLVSNAAGLASLLVIAPLGALGAVLVLAARAWNLPWLPLAAGVVVLAVAARVYSHVLNLVARYCEQHTEDMERELVV